MYTTVTNYLHKFMVQTMRIFSDCIPSYTLQVTQCTPDITAQQEYVHQEYLIHAQCLLVTISMTPLTRFISRMNILPTENTKIISFVPIKPPAMYHNLAPLRKEKNAQLSLLISFIKKNLQVLEILLYYWLIMLYYFIQETKKRNLNFMTLKKTITGSFVCVSIEMFFIFK